MRLLTGWSLPGMAPGLAGTKRFGAARRCSDGPAAGGAWRLCDRLPCSAATALHESRGAAHWLCAGRLAWNGMIAPTTPMCCATLGCANSIVPQTSSIGRLFDGAAALLGLVSRASYEGQAASYLEAISGEGAEPIALPLSRRVDGIWETDWRPLLNCLMDATQTTSGRAAMFHATLAEMLLAQARAVRDEYGEFRLGLTGGVFQNRLLCELVLSGAERDGFLAFIPERLPCNDAGLSFGQIVEASANDRR